MEYTAGLMEQLKIPGNGNQKEINVKVENILLTWYTKKDHE